MSPNTQNTPESVHDAEELELRLRTLLPDTYELFDDEVLPASMGSAGLKYGTDGRVAWNEIWGSFCDLAMAGGPPHRGTLLLPSRSVAPNLQTSAYDAASAEICRGLSLVTGLCAEPSPAPGWVRMYCTSAAMAGWLRRAIVMENVSAGGEGLALELPSGAAFRVEKEVKNVITSVAKTCHYWQEHMSRAKHDEIAHLLAKMTRESPLIVPDLHDDAPGPLDFVAGSIHKQTGLKRSNHGYTGWLGLECGEIVTAIWMMRALVVSNLLSRREGTVVFVPVNRATDDTGERVAQAVRKACRLALRHGMLTRSRGSV